MMTQFGGAGGKRGRSGRLQSADLVVWRQGVVWSDDVSTDVDGLEAVRTIKPNVVCGGFLESGGVHRFSFLGPGACPGCGTACGRDRRNERVERRLSLPEESGVQLFPDTRRPGGLRHGAVRTDDGVDG